MKVIGLCSSRYDIRTECVPHGIPGAIGDFHGYPRTDLGETLPICGIELLPCVAEQLDAIDNGFAWIANILGIHRRFQAPKIHPHPALIHRQRDGIEIALQPRLQHQPPIHRILQRGVALLKQSLIPGVELHEEIPAPRSALSGEALAGAGHDAALAHRHERAAVEAFEDGEAAVEGVDLLADAGEPVAFGFGEAGGVGAVQAVGGERVGGAGAGGEVFEAVAIALGGGAGGDEVAGGGPVGQEGVEALQHLGAALPGEGVHLRDEGVSVEAGGLAQAADAAGTLHLGNALRGFGEGDAVGELAVEGVVGEVDVPHVAGDFAEGAFAAVAADEAAEVGDLVAVGERLAVGGLGDLEGGDVLGGEREEFVALADAVLVEVTPELELCPVGVGGIDEAVGVGVFLGECGEAVGGEASCVELGTVAEEFAAGVDEAVVVAVEDEEGVVRLDPAGGSLDAVGVVVEEDGGIRVDAGGF